MLASKMHCSSHSPPDGMPLEEHSPHGVDIPSKGTTPSAQAAIGCGCRCGGCTCSACYGHGNVFMPDSNCETYGGQGTSVIALSRDLSNLRATSLEAQGPKNVVAAPPSLELLSRLNDHNPARLAESRTEQYLDDLDDAPWRYFTSERSLTSDATEMSGLFFGPMDLEGSMENNPVSSSSASALSSYKSAMSVRSEAASAVIKHAGAALTDPRPTTSDQRRPYLKLL